MADIDGGGATIASTKIESGKTVVTLRGELDIASVDELRSRLREVLPMPSQGVVFDLSTLGFMDSSGLALLVWAANEAGPVSVRQPSSTVQRLIEVTGLTDVLRIEE